MRRSGPRIAALAAAAIAFTSAASDASDAPWAATIYYGMVTEETWTEALSAPFAAESAGATLALVGLSRRWTGWALRDVAVLEAGSEGLVGRNFGGQDHWELSLAPAVARVRAPSGIASASFSLGLSMASEVPAAERRLNRGSAATMTYWALEAELGPAPGSMWSVAGRLHHRSTGYGLFGDSGGSNSFVLGLRRRF